jgi:hypothetical protein
MNLVSEQVLCQVSLEYQSVQYALISCIERERLFVAGSFLGQRHQLALDLRFSSLVRFYLLEHHDVILALHGVLHRVLALGQEHSTNPRRSRESDIPAVGDSKLVLAGARYQTQRKNAHRDYGHKL